MWPHAKTFITMVTHLHSESAIVRFYSYTTLLILLCRKSGLAVLKLAVSVEWPSKGWVVTASTSRFDGKRSSFAAHVSMPPFRKANTYKMNGCTASTLYLPPSVWTRHYWEMLLVVVVILGRGPFRVWFACSSCFSVSTYNPNEMHPEWSGNTKWPHMHIGVGMAVVSL